MKLPLLTPPSSSSNGDMGEEWDSESSDDLEITNVARKDFGVKNTESKCLTSSSGPRVEDLS